MKLRDPRDGEILRLALPAFGALAAEPLYVLADTAIVGHLGTRPLAGLAVAGTLLTVAFGIFNFLAYATTAAVARRITPRQALENLQTLEQTQRLLHTNVQEALALEVSLLKLRF